MAQQHYKKLGITALTLCVVAFTGLVRLRALPAGTPAYRELIGWKTLHRDLSSCVYASSIDGYHGVLYYVLLRPYARVFGDRAQALRILSMAFVLSTSVVLMMLLDGDQAAVDTSVDDAIASRLLVIAYATCAYDVRFSSEATPLAFVHFLASVGALLLSRAFARGNLITWIAALACTAALMGTCACGPQVALAQGAVIVYMLLQMRNGERVYPGRLWLPVLYVVMVLSCGALIVVLNWYELGGLVPANAKRYDYSGMTAFPRVLSETVFSLIAYTGQTPHCAVVLSGIGLIVAATAWRRMNGNNVGGRDRFKVCYGWSILFVPLLLLGIRCWLGRPYDRGRFEHDWLDVAFPLGLVAVGPTLRRSANSAWRIPAMALILCVATYNLGLVLSAPSNGATGAETVAKRVHELDADTYVVVLSEKAYLAIEYFLPPMDRRRLHLYARPSTAHRAHGLFRDEDVFSNGASAWERLPGTSVWLIESDIGHKVGELAPAIPSDWVLEKKEVDYDWYPGVFRVWHYRRPLRRR